MIITFSKCPHSWFTRLKYILPGRSARAFAIIIICLHTASASASSWEDTVRLMNYNLLSYGTSGNTPSYKNPRLRTIITHIRPDIFGATEISASESHVSGILDNVLDKGWAHGRYQNEGRQNLVNMLYWNAGKFTLKSQELISRTVRDIIAYRLFFNSPDLSGSRDTVFLTVIMAHLKAGNDHSNAQVRYRESRSIANYIQHLDKDEYYVLMGDLNLYSSDEDAYSELTGSAAGPPAFYDPVNRNGNWNRNPEFTDVHTQSTRRISEPDGGASGGLDDRFDFILISGSLLNRSGRVSYLKNSYRTAGQDGKRLNKAVNAANPPNTEAPFSVIQALYEMSDHLPVSLQLTIRKSDPTGSISEASPRTDEPLIYTTLNGNRAAILFPESMHHMQVSVTLTGMTGRQVFSSTIRVPSSGELYSIPFPESLPQGIYIIELKAPGKPPFRHKTIKHNQS